MHKIEVAAEIVRKARFCVS